MAPPESLPCCSENTRDPSWRRVARQIESRDASGSTEPWPTLTGGHIPKWEHRARCVLPTLFRNSLRKTQGMMESQIQ